MTELSQAIAATGAGRKRDAAIVAAKGAFLALSALILKLDSAPGA
jgi:hypothetical protein